MISFSISRLRACGVLLCLMVGSVSGTARAQSGGTIRGEVVDGNGGLIPNATVILSFDHPAGPETNEQKTVTDSAGKFSFGTIVSRDFHLKIVADGFEPGEVTGASRTSGSVDLPPVVLRIAYTNTQVSVTASQQEIAEEEVHVEEHQRVVGFVPNYFVTYSKNVVPLTAKQKYSLGLHVTFDPTNLVFAGIRAGVEQGLDSYPGWGQDAAGFGQRYGAALADSTLSTMLRGSVFPALFHQDPRYFYKGTGTNWQRARYALETAVLCHGDNGKLQPNYSDVAASLSAGGLSNLYYPASSRNGVGLTFENGFLSLAGVGVGHLLQEFLFKHLTKNVPNDTN
jgi:hypothetical protein